MYVTKSTPQQSAIPGRGGYQRLTRRHHHRGMSGLGDTCWTDAVTGANVCNGGDPTGETSCTVANPYYTPSSTTMAPDGTQWAFSVGGNILLGTAAKGADKWTFTFMYHSGYSDVYQRTSGADCMRSKFSCSYIQVASNGNISFLAAPPAQQELGCSNITTGVSTGTTVATVTSTPVYTGASSYPLYNTGGSSSPYVSAAPAAAAKSSGFSLGSIPTWALVAGAAGGGLLISKMMGKR
jgi:hypothetical protein